MKIPMASLTAFSIWLITSSCSHTIVCKPTQTIAYFLIQDYDTTVKQYVRVVRYEAGSNFTKPIDSAEETNRQPFSLAAEKGKDYAIVVLPQNRRHTIT